MQCDYFGQCGSCTLYEMDYDTQLMHKLEAIQESFGVDDIDIVRSKPERFRIRAEFRIFHDYDAGTLSYAMHGFEKRHLVPIGACSIVSEPIARIMQPLLDAIAPNEIVRHRLYSVEFLSSEATGEVLVTLIYHKKIDADWEKEAQTVARQLGIDLIGRSRGVKIVVTKAYIEDRFEVATEAYRFRLYDTGFTQPNASVNAQMIDWVQRHLTPQRADLLELYCGHGNFTIPLSRHFNSVLATEISKRSIMTAKENCTLNGVENIAFVRLSAEELTQALEKERTFRRLEGIDLQQYRFSHLFVDPPRAGLDAKSREFTKKFDNLIYISCNPETLKRDLDFLQDSFQIVRFAVFDQFAYTKHLECGVMLQKR